MRKIITAVIILSITVVAGLWIFNNVQNNQTKDNVKQSIRQSDHKEQAIGQPKAPVQMIEFADILCPFCAQFDQEILPKLKTDYIDKGLLRYEIRLVDKITPDSGRAAEGAYCATEQDKFWDYLDTAYTDTLRDYYNKGKTASDIDIFSYDKIGKFAESAGIDKIKWQSCMDQNTYAQILRENNQAMRELRAYSTPFFLVHGQDYSGVPPYEAFKAVIDAELKKAGY